MNFIRLYLLALVTEEDIDKFVEEWHNSSKEVSLADYLGLTQDEYKQWVENPKNLKKILWHRM